MKKKIKPYEIESLISEKEIKKRLSELASDINRFYANTSKLIVDRKSVV